MAYYIKSLSGDYYITSDKRVYAGKRPGSKNYVGKLVAKIFDWNHLNGDFRSNGELVLPCMPSLMPDMSEKALEELIEESSHLMVETPGGPIRVTGSVRDIESTN